VKDVGALGADPIAHRCPNHINHEQLPKGDRGGSDDTRVEEYALGQKSLEMTTPQTSFGGAGMPHNIAGVQVEESKGALGGSDA
jgi:hypothetical protein